MSKAAKAAGAEKAAAGVEMPFEEALQRLESIVESMEAEDLPLEKLITQYEEGMRLSKVCQAKLGEAELRIQQLEQNASGDPVTRPFVPAQEPTTEPSL